MSDLSTQLAPARIGNSALRISSIGLGTAPLGGLYADINRGIAHATLQRALERGITHFDTAPLYGIGYGHLSSEVLVGEALAGAPRDSYTIGTKVGRVVNEAGAMVFDYSRDGVLRSIEQSLARLKTDHVDMLLVHDPDVEGKYQDALDFAFPTLIRLREQGVVRAIGAGMNQWEMEWEFLKHSDPDVFLLAGRYTLLEQTSLDFLAACVARKVSVLAAGMLNSGILATGPIPGATYNYEPASAEILERVRGIERVCARHGTGLRVTALQLPAAHPAVASRIFGAVTPAEVDDNLAAMTLRIPRALWADLRAEGLLAPGTPVPG